MTHFSLRNYGQYFATRAKKFIAAFFVANLLLTFITSNVAFAASETISCGAGGNRTLTVGTYTDADGSSFTSGADLTLSQGAGAACTFTITQSQSDSAISLASLTIGSGVTLTHAAAGITADTYNQLNFNITGALTVESGGAIDVTAKGYLGSNSGANSSNSSGRTGGNVNGSDYGAGGSHGGSGGIVFTYYAGEVYDSISDPVQPGGGGGSGSLFNPAGNGGGVVKVTAASAAIDGNILAKGECTASHFAGGAGGTINMTLSGALTGSGTLSVSANANSYGDAVGGGGRIAVKGYTSLDTNLVFDVSGGNSTVSSRDGSSGTLFKKSSIDTYGHLILNNGSSSSYAYTTHLPYPVPSADQYAKYGSGYVFDDVTVSNYAELEISTSIDSSADGSANFTRKFYTASCTANDNDYSNGEIVYSSTYIRTADSSPALSDASYDYVCNAPAFLVGFSTTSASVTESQTSKSFTVSASGVADAPVTVDYAVSLSSTATVTNDYILAGGTSTIGIGESSDVINFTIVDDTDRESSETLIVTLSNASGATLAATDTYTYTILDNDTPGVTMDTGGSTTVIEGGSTDTYTMVLDTQPTANVVITPAGNADITTSPATLTFTSVNWATPQTVTVTAVNDSTAEGTESATATATAASSDVDYNGISIASVTVGVTDNDYAGVTLADSYSLSVNEQNTTTDTYTMVLDTPPTANVVITISPDSQCTTDISTATFTSSNWSTPQTITVTAVDDVTPETFQSCSIGHTASSTDLQYNGYAIASASASITDNDTPGITKAVPDDSATEGGGTANFTYVLNSQPTADVVITLTDGSSTDFTLSSYALTFTSSNWYTPQTVTLTAVDDTEPESTEYPSIGASTASTDLGYHEITTGVPSINILDNDTPGITLETSDASATEGGGTAAFSYVLATQPTANVVITLTDGSSTDFTLSTYELTFTTSNWATPQTVTFTAANDSEAENTEYPSIGASTASADLGYNLIYTAVPSISVLDNDWITVTQSGGTTDITEGGATDSYTVVLISDPYGTVEVTVTPDADCTVDTPTLTFVNGTGLTPQTVTVTAVDDALEEGDHTCTITYSVTDTGYTYSGVLVSPTVVNVTDNDGATGGFTIGAISGATTEAGVPATFTVRLTTQPTGDVTIPLSSDDTTEGTISPSSLTFTSLNWESDQTVTLTGADDSVVDGNIVYNAVLGTVTSTDGSYNNLNPTDVSVTNNDNDTAGFTIGTISGATTEAGGTATFTVKLTSQPTADVTIPLSSSDTTEGTISPSSLTFTSGNWNSNQTVTLTGADDSVVDGNVAYSGVLGTTTSSDGNYSSLDPNDVSVTNNDNDTVGFTIGAISGATTEAGGTATFTVKLTSQPTADVVVGVTSDDTTEGTLTPSSLTFTSVNWNSNQTVTLTGVNDNIDDGDVVYHAVLAAATSTDGLYSGLDPADKSVTNTDNDTAGVTITESTSSTDATEGGTTDNFTVELNSQPTANVVITLSNNSDVTLDTNELTFTPSSWSAQTVTVTAFNDSIDENAEVSTVTFATASTDPNYDDATYEGGMTIADVAVNVTDDDTAGIAVSAVSNDTSESGTTATFTVELNSQPTANVVIGLSSSDTTEGTVSGPVSPTSLTFTSGNWNTPQTVTITGVNDSIIDGSIAYSIVTATATSTDGKYSVIDPADINLSNTDNDTAGVTVGSLSSATTTEAGGQSTFTMVLNTQPTANVVIGVSSSDTTEGTVSPSSVTFTSSNWNTPQTLTISGVNDSVADGDISYSIITAAASSTDSDYNSVVNPSDVNLSNVDNDTVGITVSALTGDPTTEAGGTATFTVVLSSEPAADVIVGVSSSDTTEGTVAPSSLTFTNVNWNIAQTVTITGVDDSLNDGDISYSIVTAASTSSDTTYNNIDPTNPSLSNTDDDTAGVTFSALSAAATTEAGGTSTYTMVLNSQPTADVVIALTSSNTAEATVAPASVTFTASNWNQTQTVTVTGVDEDIDDGNTAYTIAAAITTDDTTGYSPLTLTNRSLTNTDDDTAAITVDYTTASTDEAGTTQLTFTVVLASQPTADVTVAVVSDDTTEGTVSASSLIFTSANWSTPQTVTITGADDTADDGDIAYSILLGPAVSTDSSYDATVISSLAVTNTDNDAAAVAASGGFFTSIINTSINQSTPDVTEAEQPVFNGVKIENLETEKLIVEDGNVDKITALVNEDEQTRVVIDEKTKITLANGEPYTGKIEVPTVVDQSQAVSATSTFNASYSFVNAIFVDTHAQHIYFDKPVVVTVPLENLEINPDKMEIWTYNEEIDSWQKLETRVIVNYGKRNISFEVNKFSYIAVLQNQVFDDTERHWASHFILELTKERVVKGVSKNNFEPDRAVTRAELVKMALLGFGYTVETTLPLNFKDVGLDHWSHNYIATAVKKGLIKGYEDGTFRPDDIVSRAEALKIVIKAGRLDVKNVGTAFKMQYSDTMFDAWYLPYLRFAAYKELIEYTKGAKFRPNDGMTRAEAAKIIVKTREL